MAQNKNSSKLNEVQEAGVKRQGFSKKTDREKISCEVKSIFTHPTRYFACFSFPQVHRKKIRTTNSLERFNEKIRRRTK